MQIKNLTIISCLLFLFIHLFSCSNDEPPVQINYTQLYEGENLSVYLNHEEIDYVDSVTVEKQNLDKYKIIIYGFPAKGRITTLSSVTIIDNKFSHEFNSNNLDNWTNDIPNDYFASYIVNGEFLIDDKDKFKAHQVILNFFIDEHINM